VAAAVYGIGVVAVQTAELSKGSLEGFSPIGALALLALGLAAAAAFLRTDPVLFARTIDRPIVAPDPAMTPDDLRMADRLEATMRTDRAYRSEQLSVGALAATLGLPEYQLRRLINQKLGHRDFAAYLNQWRIGEVKQALADAAQREVPISTIALDAGFGSLGAFNRAFKEATGVTPSTYRARVAPDDWPKLKNG
jgi:AraC-like DNA-binding protein